MAQVGFGSANTVGGSYLQALQSKSIEQTFSIKEDLKVSLSRDSYERSNGPHRWASFQGGEGWMGIGAGPMSQPYSPWQPFRNA